MNNKYSIMWLMVLLVGFTSCNKKQLSMQTVINEDGTCERVVSITCKGGSLVKDSLVSSDVVLGQFVDTAILHFDDSWKATWSPRHETQVNEFPISQKELKRLGAEMKKKGMEGTALDTIRLDLRRSFASVDEMCKNMPLKYNGKRLEVKGELKKMFKWFYTDYTYTETYKSIGGEYETPVTKYLTEEETNTWFVGLPQSTKDMKGNEVKVMLDQIEGKICVWAVDNMMRDLAHVLLRHYDSIENPPMDKKTFASKCDSLVTYSIEHIYAVWEENNFAERMMEEFFKSNAYNEAMEMSPFHEEYETAVNEKYLAMSDQSNVDYALTLPGEIISTGEGTLVDGVVHYKFSMEKLVPHDYVITATSRVKNIWTYVVSVLIILVAVGSFIYKRR